MELPGGAVCGNPENSTIPRDAPATLRLAVRCLRADTSGKSLSTPVRALLQVFIP